MTENMSNDLDLPPIPRRRLSVSDIVLLVGTPAIAYLGNVGAGMGMPAGLVLAAFAAFATVVFRVGRLGRRNEPRIPRYTHYLMIGVAVVIFVTAWGLYRASPQPAVVVYLMPLMPVALFGLLVILMFWRRR